MARIIGIDFGTKKSIVSVFNNGQPFLIPSKNGSEKTPSIVAFKNRELLIGQSAKQQVLVDPENTVYSIKRFLGRKYNDISLFREMVPYCLAPSLAGDILINIPVDKIHVSPLSITTMLFAKLKSDAEAFLNEPANRAVISVPSNFNYFQRQALHEAAKNSGLDAFRLLNDISASAVNYIWENKNKAGNILFFDLGGGKFDTSVIAVGEQVIQPIAHYGEALLGGDDWDERIVEWMILEFQKVAQFSPRQDPKSLQGFREIAEKIKIDLSSLTKVEFTLPYFTPNNHELQNLQLTIARPLFEELTQNLIQRCKAGIYSVLEDAELAPNQIDEIFLVGGSSRMPMVRQLLRQIFNMNIRLIVSEGEVVAKGTAVMAGIYEDSVPDILLIDVLPSTLGVAAPDGSMLPILRRGTGFPSRKSCVFTTSEVNQSTIVLDLVEGENKKSSYNLNVGQIIIEGLQPARQGEPKIELIFDLDAVQNLKIKALDLNSGKELPTTLSINN